MSISDALSALDCWAWRIQPGSRRLHTLHGTSPLGQGSLTWRDALRMCSPQSRRALLRAARALRAAQAGDAGRSVTGIEVPAAAGFSLQLDLLLGRDFAGAPAGAWVGLVTRGAAAAPGASVPLPAASADQLSLALETAGTGWWSLDRATRRVTLSPAAARLLGYGVDACQISMAVWMSRASAADFPRWSHSLEAMLTGHLDRIDIELWDEQPYPASARSGVRVSGAVSAAVSAAVSVGNRAHTGPTAIVGLVQPLAAPAGPDTATSAASPQAAAPPGLDRAELVREIHHRIKNHLQGMTGLIERYRNDYPGMGPALDAIGSQLQAIGTVYGLLTRSEGGDLALEEIARAVVDGLSGISPHGIRTHFPTDAPRWHIAESFCVSVALVINELTMNAIKHSSLSSDNSGVAVICEATERGYVLRIRNPGVLPDKFDFAAGTGVQTGLQLVRAMLPARGAALAFRTEGPAGCVDVELSLERPVLAPAPLGRAPSRS